MPKKEAVIDIQNVVSCASLNQRVDLDAMVRSFPEVEYRRELFPGLVFRLKRPKTATLIFSTGRMVCTGAKTEGESSRAVMTVVKKLKEGGLLILGKPDFKVVNIVASASLGGKVDLERAVTALGSAIYEPEQFPGLIYRMKKPKTVILVFASGSLVCTGATKESDVYDSVHNLHEIVEEKGLIFYE
jgi:transcription initiation factor TFIID TATA-box-binding protein